MSRVIKYHKKARESLVEGILKICDIVKTTIGPMGQSVLIDEADPILTNNGYLIANSLDYNDRFEYMGARLVVDAAYQTFLDVGDGSTQTILIASKLIQETNQILNSNITALEIQTIINQLYQRIPEILNANTINVGLEFVESIALNSSFDIMISSLLANVYQQYGTNIAVVVDRGSQLGMNYQVEGGIVIESGYLSKIMVTNPMTRNSILRNPDIVFVGERYDLTKILNQSDNPMLLIFSHISSPEIHNINKYISTCRRNIVAIRSNGNSEVLDDLRIQANMVALDGNLIGRASEVVVTEDQTIIYTTRNEEYINQLKAEMLSASSETQEHLRRRIARISDGLIRITIGGGSDIEYNYQRERINVAVSSINNALENGVVRGEGISYIEVLEALRGDAPSDLEDRILRIFTNAFSMPYRHILRNAGINEDIDFKPFDFAARQFVNSEDFIIYDPVNVVRSVIHNSISALLVFLSTNTVITNI